MPRVYFPYGDRQLCHDFAQGELSAVLTSSIEEYDPGADGASLVAAALDAPIGSPPLEKLAEGCRSIVLIASDHTRPVPSRVLLPAMLARLRAGAPDACITILIATGCHRATTEAELRQKLGNEIFEKERIHIHDCDDADNMVFLGTLPSGGPCMINRLAAEADLLVAEGFIEPHFFAGYSGGRKSVLPGVAARKTVLANHCAAFIDHPAARTGVLEENPIHRDMLWAAKTAGLRFILNVVLNEKKQIIRAVAGDPEAAHRQGTDFLARLCRVSTPPADIVITTNGGYPLDQNVYQAVKGMTAAEAAVRPGGVIIMLARSADGIGGAYFSRQLQGAADIQKTLALFRSRLPEETEPDQWQTQILLRVLSRARVIYLSDLPDETVRSLRMIPAHSIEEALALAKKLTGSEKPSVTAIPDGVSVMVLPE